MSVNLRQLPVKGIRWTASLALSAFLTSTALNYFIGPEDLVFAIHRLGAAYTPRRWKAALTAVHRPARPLQHQPISNPIA